MAKARSENRRERLAEALKENLKRRKTRRRAAAKMSAGEARRGDVGDPATGPNPAAKPQ